MSRLTLFFQSYIPQQVEDSHGHDVVVEKNGKNCLPLSSWCSDAFASYETDSADTSRLYTVVSVTFNQGQVTDIAYSYGCDKTVQHPGYLSLSNEVETLKANPTFVESHKIQGNIADIHFVNQGANPFFNYFGYDVAPSISTDYQLRISQEKTDTLGQQNFSIKLQGNLTLFPAHRIDLVIDDSDPISLSDEKPQKGRTPFDLFWGRSKTVNLELQVSTPPKSPALGVSNPS